MIIKSMARKAPSFDQLIQYFHKDAYYRKAPVFTHNMWDIGTPEEAAEELKQNATFLPKRANGNYLYHECIMLGHHPNVDHPKQERILLDLVQRYVELRAPDQMVYGRMHLDTNYLHFHLCITANTVRGKQRQWLSKAAFSNIQRELEKYKLSKYPELGDEKYYDLEARKQKREKAKADKAKLSRSEFELKKRSGKLSQKERDRIAILDVFETALSELEVTQRLSQLGFEMYKRGETEGVVKTDGGRKYRLKTLGLTHDLQKAKNRLRVYDERRADLMMSRARHTDENQRGERDDDNERGQ